MQEVGTGGLEYFVSVGGINFCFQLAVFYSFGWLLVLVICMSLFTPARDIRQFF